MERIGFREQRQQRYSVLLCEAQNCCCSFCTARNLVKDIGVEEIVRDERVDEARHCL
jgi:hypothetical protein